MKRNILNTIAGAMVLLLIGTSSCNEDANSTREGETKWGYTTAPQYDSTTGTDQMKNEPDADTQKVNTVTGEPK